VASTGGPSQDLQPEFLAARHPLWSPDGNHLLFYGLRKYVHPEMDNADWWVAPGPNGPRGAAVNTGAWSHFRGKGLVAGTAGVWLPGERIVFSAARGDTWNLWQAAISPKTWQFTATPERLTFGTGMEDFPSGAGGRLVFASLTRNVDIWSVPLDANRGADRGKVAGPIQRLTEDASLDTNPAISRDGKKLAFRSTRSGNWEIWIKDLERGKETAVTTAPGIKGRPVFSGDASKVAFDIPDGKGTQPVYMMDLGPGSTSAARVGALRKVCEDCLVVWDWSSDERYMLYWSGEQRLIGALDLVSGEKKDLLRHPEYALLRANFSPANDWLSFSGIDRNGFIRLFIAPFRGLGVPDQREWILLTEKATLSNSARWSPDGNLVYFVSGRDGFACIWAQPLDRVKKPVGPPFEVYPLHSARRSMKSVPPHILEISVARDKLVFPLNERTGNIWLAEP
jgi:Tol biopolymer transport system component